MAPAIDPVEALATAVRCLDRATESGRLAGRILDGPAPRLADRAHEVAGRAEDIRLEVQAAREAMTETSTP